MLTSRRSAATWRKMYSAGFPRSSDPVSRVTPRFVVFCSTDRTGRTSLRLAGFYLRRKVAQLLRDLGRFLTAPEFDDAIGLLPELQPLDATLMHLGEDVRPRPMVLLVDGAAGAALLALGTVLARRLLPPAARWTIAQILRRLPFEASDRLARLFD